MTFEKWFESYAPTAPECLDDCARAAWNAGQAAERRECGEMANKQAARILAANTYRGRVNQAASFAAGLFEELGMTIRARGDA